MEKSKLKKFFGLILLSIFFVLAFQALHVAASQPLPIKIKKVTGSSALIEFRGATGIYSVDDERVGVFRVVDINPDRVVVFSIQDNAEQSFPVGDPKPAQSASQQPSKDAKNEVITSPAGTGGFKIIGIIGNKGSYNVIMEKGGVQITLSAGQTVEEKFTVREVKADGVVLYIIPENITGTFSPGNEILSGK